MIRETNRPANHSVIPIDIEDVRFDVLVDTCASGNYVSKPALSSTRLTKLIPKTPTKITLGDGSTTEVSESIELKSTITNLQSTIYTAIFDIIKSSETSIILGMSFLLSNSYKINLVAGTLTVDKQEYELNDQYCSNTIEGKLIQKTQINQMEKVNSDGIHTKEITNIIEKAKQKNPRGDIKNVLREIQLKEMPLIRKKQYPGPLGIKKEVKEFFEDLEKKNIIKRCVPKHFSPAFFIKKGWMSSSCR